MSVLAAAFIAAAVLLAIPRHSATRVRSLSGHTVTPLDNKTPSRWFARGKKGRDPELHMAYALRALAAELRSGSSPNRALEESAGDPPLWPRALVAARLGESVAAGLERDAAEAGGLASTLRQLAACWKVGVAHGAGLAASVERLALSAREQHELNSTLRSELAASQATTRLLAMLPLVGIAMGYLLGADPIGWFLGSPVGIGLLSVAALLTGAGILWTRRIAGRVRHVL